MDKNLFVNKDEEYNRIKVYERKYRRLQMIVVILCVAFSVVSFCLSSLINYRFHKLVFLEEHFRRYYMYENIEEAMKNVLGSKYITDSKENFSNYVLSLVTNDIRKYDKGRWGSYTYFTTKEQADKHQELSIKMSKEGVYSPYPGLEDTYYIKPNRFTREMFDMHLKDNIKEMKKYKNLIIDFRGNPGGEIKVLIDFLSLFCDKDDLLLISEEYNYGEKITKEYINKRNRVFDNFSDIVILIDGNTASCAESATLSLRENLDNVIVIGDRSFGKFIGSNSLKFKDGSKLSYVNSLWHSPNKTNYSMGIEPDILEVDYELQEKKAIEYLINK